MLFTEKCVQCMVTNGPMKKTLGGQKFASDRGSMGRSSVACTAADFVFLHRAFTNLLKDGANV